MIISAILYFFCLVEHCSDDEEEYENNIFLY